MKPNLFPWVLAAAALTLTSCSSNVYGPMDESGSGATFQQGVPGGTVVDTHDFHATITSIDSAARKVTLRGENGEKETVKCGPGVVNFEQLRVGDVVQATLTSEVTVAMADAANPLPRMDTSTVAVAPRGAKPGILVAETQQYTATITKIDLKRRQAVLRFPDGSLRTFEVRKDVDMTQRKVGEEVSVRVALSIAVSIRTSKP
jgi:hypothetical protein